MIREKLIDLFKQWRLQQFVPYHTELAMLADFLVMNGVTMREQGEWTGKTFPTCSCCGAWLEMAQGTAELNYCPNCGAKMDDKGVGKNEV